MLTTAVVGWLFVGAALIPPPPPCIPEDSSNYDCYLRLAGPDRCTIRLGEWDGWRMTWNYKAVFSGTCRDGYANGAGVLRLTNSDGEWREFEGMFSSGRPEAGWSGSVGPLAAGTHADGLVVREGVSDPWLWVLKSPDGWEMEGPIGDGRRQGYWVERHPDGVIHRGWYVDGQRHGIWVEEQSSGLVETGPYVNGKRSGEWNSGKWPDWRYRSLNSAWGFMSEW